MGPISLVRKTETMIELNWSEITGVQTGDSEITAYTLYWDDNTGVVDIMLVSSPDATSYVAGRPAIIGCLGE